MAAHESDPQDFETLLGTKGVGATTVRALSLLAELIYEAPTSRRDPADAKLPGEPGSASTPGSAVGRLLVCARRKGRNTFPC